AHLFTNVNMVSLLLAKDVPVTFSNPLIVLLLAPLFEITKYPTKLADVNNNNNPTKMTPAYIPICIMKLFVFNIARNTSPPNILRFVSTPVPSFPTSLVLKYLYPSGCLFTSDLLSVLLFFLSFFLLLPEPLNSLLLLPFLKSNP